MSKLKKHIRNYTQVPNDIINDKRLSLKAKGLYLFLVSKPDNWDFSARLIASQNDDSESAIKRLLNELENYGLLFRVHVYGGYDYELFDTIKTPIFRHASQNDTNVNDTYQKDTNQKAPIISNTQYSKRKEEREINKLPISSDDSFLFDLDPFYVDLFLDQVSSSRSVKNKIAYRASVRLALINNDEKTVLAYEDFVANFSIDSVKKLPSDLDVFGLYEQM
ncbi:helix-turn-helix domain-containing protein [Sulfuricurvum sp.]|uniref:helix-turn-helix domain-containing protein n=1 Tax=Sulfuricurvum sp. TaxID=2025608 RepID=UPI003567949D